MKIFVVNLARRPDRLAHMRSQLADFERIDAVDGSEKVGRESRSTEDRCGPDVRVARFRFWCAKGYRIKPGEIGAALSHQKVYREILARGLDMACVLEDDVTLLPGFVEKMDKLKDEMRFDAPEVTTFGDTAAGYLINRLGAERMLELNVPIRSTADDWCRWVRGGLHWRKIDGILTVPPYGDPHATGIARSDIIGDARHFVANMSFGRKIVYKIARVFGKAVDLLWR